MSGDKDRIMMRILLTLIALCLFTAACGKKAPLRPPEKKPEQSSMIAR